MKLSAIYATAIFALSAYSAAVDSEHQTHTLQARACNIDDVCLGTGGGDLCNDRCKKCKGDSGYYKKGECGGLGWQRCYCYYS
ncbi:uncharacterized protein KD926_002267 [Aspergillus affinis]|uniref:uncharacterized protein n=1 Tax=Aspergillus affinis TaxID=1070780 RepID=UPI0022FE2BCA|nr:uncharacterized protein KD926_002267 [Aspergillus affinis]KAI9036126.1 hypothetical protein KD926_002267 [Aspergillus affinis]